MLYFPINPQPHMPFASMPMGETVFTVLQPITFVPTPRASPSGLSYDASTLYILAIVWTALCMALLAFATWLWYQEDDFLNGVTVYRPNWPVRLLRTAGRVTVVALFVPLVSILLHPFNCASGQVWSNTPLECFTGVHALYVALSAVFLPLLLAFCALVAALYLDRRPDPKRNLLSQPHGRVAVANLAVKLMLCFAFQFGVGASADNWFLLVLALAAGLAQLVAFARYLPYHTQWVNELQCAIIGVYVAAAVSSLLANGVRDAQYSVGVWTFMFTFPLAAFVGWALAFMSSRTYVKRRELGSPYMVEIKARIMHQELQEDMASANVGNPLAGTVAAPAHGGHGAKAGIEGGIEGRRDHGLTMNDREARLRDIQNLYEDAAGIFSGSSILELFVATFLGYVQRNRHLELMHLRAAEAKSDTMALDIRFFCWERMRIIDQEEAANNSVRTSVIRRLQFDRLAVESENLCMRARQLISEFWAESCERNPDMARMSTVGTGIIVAIRQGDNVFRQLMELAPQSAAVMRSYADFLLEISNNPRKAIELLQAAEQIEEDESKAHAGGDAETKDYPFMARAPEFDLSNENVSLVRISGDPGRLGVITDANPASLKLFGYGRRELIGKNIDALLPEPLASVHQRFLERYMQTGREIVVNTSRVLMGLHRNGHLILINGNIRPMENGFGGVFEEVATSQAFLFFMGEPSRWRVTGACKTSMALLNISSTDLKNGSVTMDRLLPGIATERERERDRSMKNEDDDGAPHSNHSPLMNDLINAASTVGPGLDVTFQIAQWSVLAAAMARSERRSSLHNKSARATQADLDASAQTVRTVYATAKLQETAIAFLPAPIYVLRWRVAKGLDGGIDGITDVDEGDRESDAGSNSVQGSQEGARSDDDDETEDEGVVARTPLLQKLAAKQQAQSGKKTSPNGSIQKTGGGAGARYPLPLVGTHTGLQQHGATPASAHASAVGTGLDLSGIHAQRAAAAATAAAAAAAAEPVHDLSTPNPSINDSRHDSARGSALTAALEVHEHGSVGSNGLPGGGDAAATAAAPAAAAEGPVVIHSAPTSPEQAAEPAPAEAPAPVAAMIAFSPTTAASEQHHPHHHVQTTPRQPASRSEGRPLKSALSTSKMRMSSHDLHGEAVSDVSGSALDAPSAPSTGRRGSAAGRKVIWVDKTNVGHDVDPKITAVETESAGHLTSSVTGSDLHNADGGDMSAAAKKRAASVNSGSSAGSSSVSDALRKGITMRSRDMESSLVNLRRSLVAIFLFIGAMNIVSLIISRVLFTELMDALAVVADNGARGIALQTSYSEIQRLELMAEGILATNDEGNATKARLDQRLTQLALLHESLYQKVDEGNEAERSLYSTPSITVEDLVPGSFVSKSVFNVTSRQVNLMNAGLEIIAKSRQVLNRNYSINTIDEPTGAVFFLLHNGPTRVRNGFNDSMIIAQDKTSTQGTVIMLANNIVLALALFLLVLVTATVMIPAVQGVIRQKASVFHVVLNTPLPILRSLKAKTEAKIMALRRANDEADAGLDVGGRGEADEEEIEAAAAAEKQAAAAMASALAQQSSRNKKSNADEKDKDKKGSKDGKEEKTERKKHHSHRERHFKRAASVSISTLGPFVWPMVVLLAYYVGE